MRHRACAELMRRLMRPAYARQFRRASLCGRLMRLSRWLMAGRLMVHKPLLKLFARRNCLCGLWCVLGLLRERLVLACAYFFSVEILFSATQYIYIYIFIYTLESTDTRFRVELREVQIHICLGNEVDDRTPTCARHRLHAHHQYPRLF